MSFETQAKRSGREPITLAELMLDRCVHRYGQAPCTAAIGITGDTFCFNTRATCQDVPNYSPAEHALRFCTARAKLPPSLHAVPSLKTAELTPAKIEVEGGLGQRASVQLMLQDHPYHDRLLDPYYRERYGGTTEESLQALSDGTELQALSDGTTLLALPARTGAAPTIAGTFWGRLLARSPYYQARRLLVRTGYIVEDAFDLANFVTREYLLESIAGPDPNGNVAVKAKDPLKLTDDERAQAPFPSTGRLAGAMDESVTTFTLEPAGIGDAEYPSTALESFYVRIGSEVLEVTNRAGDVCDCQRTQFGTDEETHDVDDTVQLCLRYAAERAHVIYRDLLETYAQVPVSYIDFAEWTIEADLYLPRTYSTLITSPTPVEKLIKELTQSALFTTWYDERQAQIMIRALRDPDSGAPMLNETQHIIADSVVPTFKPDMRISQAWVYFGPIDPTEGVEEVKNYRQLAVAADLESEGPNKFRSPAINKLFSRWITSRTNADEVAIRKTQLFGEVPRQIKFSLDAKDGATVWLGDLIRMTSRLVQDSLGRQLVLTGQIIEADETDAAHKFAYTMQVYNFSAPIDTGLVISIAVDANDVNLLDVFTDLYGDPTAATAVTFVVEAGVIIGQDVAAQAMTTGSWPTGATIQLENNGRIQGRGGNGATFDGSDGVLSGTDGGTAFKAEAAITVTNASEIWGGGGGGMGEVNSPGFGNEMNPGGGGAGTLPGLGGERATGAFGDWAGTGEFSANGTSTAGGAATTVGEEAAGGDGGDPGEEGGDGPDGVGGDDLDFGAAGPAVRGNSLITWITTGDRRGDIL